MTEPVPPDVVPRRGIAADTIRLLDSAHHHPISITVPGDVLTDPDGVPLGMTEPRTVTGNTSGLYVSAEGRTPAPAQTGGFSATFYPKGK